MQGAFIAQGDEKAKEWLLPFPDTPLRGPMNNMISLSGEPLLGAILEPVTYQKNVRHATV
jgi:hypothetical protein